MANWSAYIFLIWHQQPYLSARTFLRFRQRKNRLALCFRKRGFCLVSRPVRQALALDTLKSRCRPFPVSEAEFGAVIMPELKLIQIPLQVLLAAKAIGALHRAFEIAEEIFGSVGRGAIGANENSFTGRAVAHRLV